MGRYSYRTDNPGWVVTGTSRMEGRLDFGFLAGYGLHDLVHVDLEYPNGIELRPGRPRRAWRAPLSSIFVCYGGD